MGVGPRLKYFCSHPGKETKVVPYCIMLDSYRYLSTNSKNAYRLELLDGVTGTKGELTKVTEGRVRSLFIRQNKPHEAT